MHFPPGKSLLSMIIGIDLKGQKIIASIRRALANSNVSNQILDSGDSTSALVVEMFPESALLLLHPSNRLGTVEFSSLSNQKTPFVSKLSNALKRGEEVRDLTIKSIDPENGMVLLIPTSLTSHNSFSAKAMDFGSVLEGMHVTGRVIASGPRSAVVRITKSVIGILHITDCVDDYSMFTGVPPVQSVIQAVVVGRDTTNSQLYLSTRPSRMSKELTGMDIVDQEVAQLEDISIGQTVRGFVKNVVTNGLFVTIGRDLDARVQIKELFDGVGVLVY